jgi:hypothetical protein
VTAVRYVLARAQIDAFGKPSAPSAITGKRELAHRHLSAMIDAVAKAVGLARHPAFPSARLA